MQTLFKIYACDIIIKDIGFFITEGVINVKAASKLKTETFNSLVKDLSKVTGELLECINVATEALYAPIAGNYVGFNDQETFGEVANAKL